MKEGIGWGIVVCCGIYAVSTGIGLCLPRFGEGFSLAGGIGIATGIGLIIIACLHLPGVPPENE